MAHFTITERRSPNFGERRSCINPDMVVIHYTAMATAEAAIERLCSPEFEVSAHYLIDSDGHVTQMVEEDKRAWHAGRGQWGNVTDVNSHSIGIELANTGGTPFAALQMDALEILLAGILSRHGIPAERVIGHSDMAPERKTDPGAHFDWRRLAVQGLSVWPHEAIMSNADGASRKAWTPDDILALEHALRAFGYHFDETVSPQATLQYPPQSPPQSQWQSPVLTAFLDRFVLGNDKFTILMAAQDLAKRFPVDQGGVTA